MRDVPWLPIVGAYLSFPVIGAVVFALVIGLEPYVAYDSRDRPRDRRILREETIRTDRYDDLKERFAIGALIGAAGGLVLAIAVHREERARAARRQAERS